MRNAKISAHIEYFFPAEHIMKKLGNSDIAVAPLAFGGNVFGWTANEATSFSLLDKFVDSGLNLIDTADVYSRWVPGHVGGESEAIIGKWLKRSGKRKQVVVATKVGMDKGLKPEHIKRAVEASLKRLQTDYIDLYQSHADDADTPQEETLAAYADLIREGKVRVIGASNFTRGRLQQARALSQQHGYPLYQTLQPEYNLYDRAGFESDLEQFCLENNIGVISYYALASGFLTGKYRSEADLGQSPRGDKVKSYLNPRGMRILDALDAVAKAYGSTPASVALAWLIARPSITAPIASATSLAQLDALVAATRLQLDAAALTQLDVASKWREK